MEYNRDPGNTRTGTPVLIFQSELACIEEETLRWPDRETGGELFGYFTYAGWPVVHRVINANATARRGSATFHPNANQIDREGRELIDGYGLQHLGQWHSHHRFALNCPSRVDRATVADAIRTYRLHSFVQVIANVRNRGHSDFAMAHAYFYRDTAPDQCQPMPWLVLPGSSPVSALTGVDVALTSAIELSPRVVTWNELRRTRGTDIANSEIPIKNQVFLDRLAEELRLLCAAGYAARGRAEGGHLRIDASHSGERFVILLPPDFPDSPPKLRGSSGVRQHQVNWEVQWSSHRRIVDLLADHSSNTRKDGSIRGRSKLMDAARATIVRIAGK